MDDALKREKTSCSMAVAFLQAASLCFSGSLCSVSNHWIHCSTTFNNNLGLSGMTDCDSPVTACQSAGPPTRRQGLSCAVGTGEKGSEGKESNCIKRNNRRSCFRIGLTFFAFRSIFTLPCVKKLFLPGLFSGTGTCQTSPYYRDFVSAVHLTMYALVSLICLLYHYSSLHSQYMEKSPSILA